MLGIYIVVIILLIWYHYISEVKIKSSIDNVKYTVKSRFSDHEEAADILAHLNSVNKKVIRHLQETDNGPDVQFLASNYNENVIGENVPWTTRNTSYVLNKGDLIRICLRNKKTGKFHDMNTLIFVSLHELSHLMDKQYGHEKSFWDSFKKILNSATELGLYVPVRYKDHPQSYCGMIIKSNPYY